eukprot:54845-Pleurochrysis_carterae.AAC.3
MASADGAPPKCMNAASSQPLQKLFKSLTTRCIWLCMASVRKSCDNPFWQCHGAPTSGTSDCQLVSKHSGKKLLFPRKVAISG